jgi:fumarate hydratase class II
VPALTHLAASLRGAQARFAHIVKAGRTHLMDAVPVTLGQEFGGYATAVELGIARLRGTAPRLGAMPLGGTAVGTGLNAPPGFARDCIAALADELDLDLHEAADHFEAQGAQDVLVEASGVCRVVAVSLNKLATDLRWMSSGPATGLGELHLPDLQPGSSIMPGKVNPVLPEAVHQVVAQVVGNDAAVAMGGASGAFELNVMLPVMADNLLGSIRLLANVSRLLADRCIDGIEADEATCRRYAESSPSLVTALVPLIGYEAAAAAAHRAVDEHRTIREVVLESGLATEQQLDEALDVRAMTRGGLRARHG